MADRTTVAMLRHDECMAFWDWNLAVVAELGTSLGTIGLAWFTYRVVSGDQEDRRQREVAGRSTQAGLVAAWFDTYDQRSDKMLLPDDRHPNYDRPEPAIIIRNGSDLPVWDVQTALVMPDGTVATNVPIRSLPVLPPRDERAIPRPHALSNVSNARVRMQFRDSAGVRWVRNEHGLLSESDAAGRSPTKPPV